VVGRACFIESIDSGFGVISSSRTSVQKEARNTLSHKGVGRSIWIGILGFMFLNYLPNATPLHPLLITHYSLLITHYSLFTARIERLIRFNFSLTSSTCTFTTSPTVTNFLGSSTKRSEIWEICTSPS